MTATTLPRLPFQHPQKNSSLICRVTPTGVGRKSSIKSLTCRAPKERGRTSLGRGSTTLIKRQGQSYLLNGPEGGGGFPVFRKGGREEGKIPYCPADEMNLDSPGRGSARPSKGKFPQPGFPGQKEKGKALRAKEKKKKIPQLTRVPVNRKQKRPF